MNLERSFAADYVRATFHKEDTVSVVAIRDAMTLLFQEILDFPVTLKIPHTLRRGPVHCSLRVIIRPQESKVHKNPDVFIQLGKAQVSSVHQLSLQSSIYGNFQNLCHYEQAVTTFTRIF